jgi:hypothetical protein
MDLCDELLLMPRVILEMVSNCITQNAHSNVNYEL